MKHYSQKKKKKKRWNIFVSKKDFFPAPFSRQWLHLPTALQPSEQCVYELIETALVNIGVLIPPTPPLFIFNGWKCFSICLFILGYEMKFVNVWWNNNTIYFFVELLKWQQGEGSTFPPLYISPYHDSFSACTCILNVNQETKGPFGYSWKLKTETENWKTL